MAHANPGLVGQRWGESRDLSLRMTIKVHEWVMFDKLDLALQRDKYRTRVGLCISVF